jgi:DNA-binding NtrC family response regulator
MSGLSVDNSKCDGQGDNRMQKNAIVLVADRNPRIRGFLERELGAAGYRVYTVDSVSRLINWIGHDELPDLLVLDPDLPGGAAEDHIWPLLARHPRLPVVFHCLPADIPMPMPRMISTVIVEKSADSIDALKRQIALLLNRNHRE